MKKIYNFIYKYLKLKIKYIVYKKNILLLWFKKFIYFYYLLKNYLKY